jgi:hypothetical protein
MGIAPKLAVGLMLALLLGFGGLFLIVNFSPQCTSDIVKAHMELERSSRNLQAGTADSVSKCINYRRHVEALEAASAVTKRCGPPQMTMRSAWQSAEGEKESYRRLVAEQCS